MSQGQQNALLTQNAKLLFMSRKSISFQEDNFLLYVNVFQNKSNYSNIVEHKHLNYQLWFKLDLIVVW